MQSIVKNNPNHEYKVIDLSIEYAGATAFVGTERYAIVTDLTEEQLTSSFDQELEPYKPFVIISREMYKAMRESHKNDNREHWRDLFFHDAFAIELEKLPVDWMTDPALICESLQTVEYILANLWNLPEKRGIRLYKHCILGYKIREIALQENTSIWAVLKSIERAKPEIYEFFVECGVVA